MTWKVTARDAYFDSQMRRMVHVEIQENEDGEARTFAFTVARDKTRRPLHQTGKEGSRRIACQQVKVNLVPVLEPKPDRRLEGLPDDEREAAIKADGLRKIHAMQQGITTTYQVGAKGFISHEDIGCDEAVRRYGRKTYDVCERIPGGLAR